METNDPRDETAGSDATLRREEELAVGRRPERVGGISVRKRAETEQVDELVPRRFEEVDHVRQAAYPNDSGRIETLPDGAISIPIFEEQLHVEKRLVVKERVVVRKRVETENVRVREELRKERIDVDVDDAVRERVSFASPADASPAGLRGPVHVAETRPFFLTSEFFVYAALVIALFVYAAVADLGVRLAWGLATAATVGYLLSRGIAKTGVTTWFRGPG